LFEPGQCRRAAYASRREFLQAASIGALGLAFGGTSARAARAVAPARSVLMLWLWGGPSHLDTFDMKPDAPVEFRGPFEPIATSVPGTRVCELLPGLARRAHKYAIVRSLHHQSNDHGVAGTIALTGDIAGAVGLGGAVNNGVSRPSTGAIVARLHRDHAGPLPPYLVLGNPLQQGKNRAIGEGGGRLGAAYDPFRLDFEPGTGLKLPDVALPEGIGEARLASRWDLKKGLDIDPTPGRSAVSLERQFELAHTLFASRSGLESLDVSRETAKVREAYGPHRFGQCCLIARRLVEAGTPFVQVNWSTHVEGPEDSGDGGWDMHDRYFQIMQDRHGWMFDRALSALLDDLEDRGLLATTLVVAVGEFGRTPRVNDKAGRDHWNNCYSALLAGAGIAGGRVLGASDKRGEHPVDHPCTPADLGATVLERLGHNAADLTGISLNPLGQPLEELYG
jgi:hypothetical protein